MVSKARPECTLIGIAGGSGSGKTTLAESIEAAVGSANVTTISMDSYYKDVSHLSEKELLQYNFDAPEAFDVLSLADHLKSLKNGKPIPNFEFDYGEKKRVIRPQEIKPKPVIVVEGILVLAVPVLRSLMDYKLFVDTPADLRLIRRCRRDIDTYQRTFSDIADQYEATVREMHETLVAPSKDYADLTIPLARSNEPGVEMLIRSVQTFAKQQPARSIRWERDEAEMLLVPAGNFLMGSTEDQIIRLARDADARLDWFNDERPAHNVFVSSFYMDKLPVTNQQYEFFIEDTGHRTPETWKNRRLREAQLPVTGVSYDDALAYCKWAGKRLPTEAEWEKAARGVNGRLYPWGETSPEGRANYGNQFHGPTRVGRFSEGASPYGILDMAGNVWEWVSDDYDPTYYLRSEKTDPKGPPSGRGHVVRGGSWVNVPNFLRCAERDFRREPLNDLQFFGFRCVAPLPVT